MNIIVAVENSSKQPEENTQALLDHLSIVYVATDESETSDESAVNMYVLHSGSSLIWIQDIHHFSQKNLLSLQFEPVLLSTSTTNFTKVASFTCKAGTSCDSGIVGIRRRKDTPAMKACLSSPVVQGYFRVDASTAQFHIESHKTATGVWSIWYQGHFDHSIVLKDVFVSKETKHILKVLSFRGPLFLPPGCWNIFSLKLAVKGVVLNLFTNVFLTTNTGAVFAIPLQIFSAPAKEGSLGFEVLAHCGMHYFMGKSKPETPDWERSLSLDRSTWDVDSELANKLYERWKKYKNGDVCRRNVLGMSQFAFAKKSKETEPFVSFLPRVVLEPGLVLNFSATALRNSVVKYFVVRNPSPWPVSLQLLPLSLYPRPEAAVRLLYKWFGTDMQMVNLSTGEFQLTKACPYQGEPSEESSLGALHVHLQPFDMRKVGVVFTPADYGKVTSLILIRNNLTVVDMVGVEGFGAQELLKVGGRLPGAGGSLRFKVPESTLMDCHRQLKDSKQILSITKNFKVENVGPLPITVTSLKINGYNCQGYGFEVLDCHPFSLSPNTSRDISIVFTPDFTSSWVIRELTLVTAAELEFHFTLNVTLPHHMLPLCAEVVPGPSWEESFWRLTVFFVSLSLLGVILIAFQQAQYILMEFMKTRQRQNGSSSPQQNGDPVDMISSHSHKSTCKNFLDTYSPSDKGRGKSCLPVGPPLSRLQNAAKRSPATYSHSQKKHKCSFYYSKQKPSASTASSANITTEEKQTVTLASSLSAAKEDLCTNILSENWASLRYASGVNGSLQRNLTLPKNVLNKEESSLKNTVVSNTSSECSMKEGIQTCMFPKETDSKISEHVAELKEQEPCPQKTSKKPPESTLPKIPPQYPQSDLPEVSRKHGNNQQVSVKNEIDSFETVKAVDTKLSSVKKTQRASPEDTCSEKQDSPSAEQDDPHRKRKLQEKREGNTQTLNWNKTRTCKKHKKRASVQAPSSPRPSEQSEQRLVCSDVRSWCAQDSTGETCKAGMEIVGDSPVRREEGDGVSPQDSPSEASVPLSLPQHVCSSTDVNGLSEFTESCPGLPAAPADAGEEKGLYPPGGLWPSQPVCLTSSFNCPVENGAPGVSEEPTSIPDSSFIDWSASCEGQFPSVYCPLELNGYNAFPEENMNYTNGFPCSSKVQTDFIGHSTSSTWNTPASMPAAWGHASLVNSPSYLTSTRSLSPMSGLFGSIWAPQSDAYENCCPVSPATEHSTHMENQVMCKEYYLGFNPFRAYMNLDIWTSTANRSANFPLSRDSGYCGNV
ncbi:transmembrane protein 131-like isoform X4 [Rattus rattus]|uniref:transmembrane protein 131-like isoform X4 n=1 Tax=Rattus rattus TaxID=10117 RepID=UPI0013F38604|nr:transmembrane protein 131-like isoform X4 [Rattus rattus]